jgi:hypothetical protein
MSFRKSVSLGLLAFLVSASHSFANTGVTPEMTLLSSVIALQGQKLSTDEVEKQLQAQVVQYDQVAPVEGRAERVSQAMVTMQVYTAAQAQQALQTQLMGIALQSQGAQFSACDVAYTMYGVGMTVFIGGLVSSVVVNWDNLVNGDGSFAKDGWLADAGIGGVVLGFVAAGISADSECGQ